MVVTLLTCDDGIHSPGLLAAKRASEKFGKVRIYAPLSQQTAVGGKVTFGKYIRMKETYIDGTKAIGINGTPIDAMRLALLGRKLKPDLVVSGINIGEQIGAVPVFTSGTCAAAYYAAAHKIPSLAVGYKPREEAHKYMEHGPESNVLDLIPYPSEQLGKIIKDVLENGLRGADFWNINFPSSPTEEIQYVKMVDYGYYTEDVEIKGSKFKNLGTPEMKGHEVGSDAHFIKNNIVITPCKINFTDYGSLDKLLRDKKEK
jgi:5'-nucleotidase